MTLFDRPFYALSNIRRFRKRKKPNDFSRLHKKNSDACGRRPIQPSTVGTRSRNGRMRLAFLLMIGLLRHRLGFPEYRATSILPSDRGRRPVEQHRQLPPAGPERLSGSAHRTASTVTTATVQDVRVRPSNPDSRLQRHSDAFRGP